MEPITLMVGANSVLLVPIYFILAQLWRSVRDVREQTFQNSIDIATVKGVCSRLVQEQE